MLVPIVTALVYAAAAYLAIGAVAALALHARGLHALDHATHGAPVSFRVLVTPGLIALWPVMLAKWRTAARGGDAVGRPERPAAAAQLRRLHGLAVRALAVALPVVIGTALAVRMPDRTLDGPNPLADPAPLPQVAAEYAAAFGALPIALRVRTGATDAWQIELDLARALDRPALGLYWTDASDSTAAPGNSVYLGNVWGPGMRRFATDKAALAAGGSLLLYSFVDAEVIATARVKAPVSP